MVLSNPPPTFLLDKNKVNRTKEAKLYPASNYHKWLPYQILGGKTVKNVDIDPQTTEIWPKELFVTLSVSDNLVRVKLSFLKIPKQHD